MSVSKMVLFKSSTEFLSPERRGGIVGEVPTSILPIEPASRAQRRGRRFGRFMKPGFLTLVLLLAALFLVSIAAFLLNFHFPGDEESGTSNSVKLQFEGKIVPQVRGDEEYGKVASLEGQIDGKGNRGRLVSEEVEQQFIGSHVTQMSRSKRRRQHFPCEVRFAESADYLIEPENVRNFSRFSINYIAMEDKFPTTGLLTPRFGGHQTLEEREKSFHAVNQTLHCGFVKGHAGLPSSGFDLNIEDSEFMNACRIVVSSCIFGNSDFLRRPTSRKISEFSKKNVCFVMFVDEQTVSKLPSDGHTPDDKGFVGLWKIVVVRNLPYEDMRRTGKVPKFLSHRLFPSSRYSIWLDSKMRLNTDPMLIIEYFLWRTRSEYAISNHYDRHCVWEEVLQNKRLNKYNHTAIDEQFNFYQSDGLTKFDPANPATPLPSYVPEGSFIVRAHTPMSNLFSCLWFNEVDRFTSRDQLSFAYTYLKLRRLNHDRPFYLHMFKDCERRALAKLFHHRIMSTPIPGP